MNVSVVMAAYNYDQFVADALRTVLKQDFTGDLECIVVDDGSTDKTAQVIGMFDQRIRLIRQQNAGQAAAFNRAVEESSGDVLCFLDADDLWDQDKVRRIVDVFLGNAHVGLVHHRLREVDESGEVADGVLMWGMMADGNVRRHMLKKVLRWCFAPTSGLCIRREIAEIIFPLPVAHKISADEFIAPVASVLEPVVYLPDILGSYRVHQNNNWASKFSKYDDHSNVIAAKMFVDLLDAKVDHANNVLRQRGESVVLSPYLNWDYMKAREMVDGKPSFSFLGKCFYASCARNGLGRVESYLLFVELTRRAIKRIMRRRPDC